MYNNRKKAFTLIELIIVVAIVGILMLATTVYIGGSDEKRKVIEAQGCANTIGGEINNFIFYALTSKSLKIDNNSVSPSYYIVQLTGCVYESGLCDKINLSYITGDSSITTYKTLSISNTCHQTKQPLRFYRSGNNEDDINNRVKMNKGLSPTSIQDKNVFYIENDDDNPLLGDIITAACLNSKCTNPREIGKFGIDSRSQTISRRNCKFYDDDPNKCKEREK